MSQKKVSSSKMEKEPMGWILRLVRSDFNWLGSILLRVLRFAWRRKPGPIETSSKKAEAFPGGPYAANRKKQIGDMLLWVPRKIDSFIIDDLTGGFGYSHITVDTGEVDLPTQKPVMVEVTIGQTVERKFQDEYASRPYARIPLSKAGINAEAFVDCVKSRLGEQYDDLEALTLGEIDDPAKQMCSGLASECLPETVKREIASAQRHGLLRRNSVSVHSPSIAPVTRVFISPNGFAQYFGAPKGKKLRETNFLVEPHPLGTSLQGRLRQRHWQSVFILGALGALILAAPFIFRKFNPLKTI